MRNRIYSTSIELPFPLDIVFEHVNDVSKWWPEEFEGRSTKLNDEFMLRSGEGHYSKQKLVEFVPNEKVVWLVIESIRKADNYEWTGTKYSFELTPNGSKTVLSFTYSGPVPENEYNRLVQVCNMVIKERLYNFITGGKTN